MRHGWVPSDGNLVYYAVWPCETRSKVWQKRYKTYHLFRNLERMWNLANLQQVGSISVCQNIISTLFMESSSALPTLSQPHREHGPSPSTSSTARVAVSGHGKCDETRPQAIPSSMIIFERCLILFGISYNVRLHDQLSCHARHGRWRRGVCMMKGTDTVKY